MRAPPPLSSAAHYPITTGTGVVALIISIAAFSGRSIESLVMDARAFHGEPWRLVTPVFAHGNWIHLLFNLYVLWLFGPSIEAELGRLKTIAMFLLFAVVPLAAEYAVFGSGIGLSGVNYGYFGFLWIASRKDSRFTSAIDSSVITQLVGWFFLCIGLTVAGIWSIANVAHGAGAVLGILLAYSIYERRFRWAYISGLVLLVALVAAGSTVARPYVNWNREAVIVEQFTLGNDAFEGKDYPRAIHHYTIALERNPAFPEAWFNLGLAYTRLAQYERAFEAFSKASELAPTNTEYERLKVEVRSRMRR